MIAHFVVVAPPARCASYAVRLPILVGRSREAKFRIQQDRVSRRHCEFTVEDGVVQLRDLGSRNGTLLGGRPVAAETPVPVPPGAVVRVGSIEFRIEYDSLGQAPTVDLQAPRAPQEDETLHLAGGAVDGPDVEIRMDAAPGDAAPRETDGDAASPPATRRRSDPGEFLDGLS
jgi:predicted component of type VI protein secretion system